MRAEHLKYATRCPAPYSYSYFWRRFEDWLDAQPDLGFGRRAWGMSDAIRGLPGDDVTSAATKPALPETPGGSLGFPGLPGGSSDEDSRGRAANSHGKIAAKLRQRSEIRFSPANAAPEPEDSGDVLSGGTPLEGGLLFISEPDTALQIRKGALCVRYRDGVERTFPRGRHRLRSIMLASPGANVTIEAMRFAIDEGIAIFVMHRAGEALAVLGKWFRKAADQGDAKAQANLDVMYANGLGVPEDLILSCMWQRRRLDRPKAERAVELSHSLVAHKPPRRPRTPPRRRCLRKAGLEQ